MAVKTLYELGRLEFSGLIGETHLPVETDEIHTVKYAIMSAEHGKHIHMEKPGRREPEDFEKLVEIMRRTGKVFHTGYMYRYNPFVMELMDRIRYGEMGEIISEEAQMNCWHPEGVRR
ncbi:MAG: hypothetical protein IJO98_02445 [Clostridia bacterium]|nr:hypothetical protein [Clostridia bacterium]